MNEKSILNKMQLLASKLGHRLFRNNTGMAWQGQVQRIDATTIMVRNATPIKFGLAVGSGDLIGGVPVVITSDMVGRTVLVFTNYEAKCNATRATKEQRNFHDMVISLGGISMIERFTSDGIEGNQYAEIVNQFQGTKPTS